MNNMIPAELICRQTSYTLEEPEQKLKQHNNDVLCDLLHLDGGACGAGSFGGSGIFNNSGTINTNCRHNIL